MPSTSPLYIILYFYSYSRMLYILWYEIKCMETSQYLFVGRHLSVNPPLDCVNLESDGGRFPICLLIT